MRSTIITFLFIILLMVGSVRGMDKLILESHRYFDYYASTDQFTKTVDSAVILARNKLVRIILDTLDYRPQIYIVNNLRDFRELVKGTVPDWGAAVAIPSRRCIVIKSPAHFRLGKSLTELVMHEYTHLALNDRLQQNRAPRWLDEGLAMYIAAEWGWFDNIALSKAVVLGSTMPLHKIEGMNLFPAGQAHTAYAESYMAVKYLLDVYEVETFNILLDSLKNQCPIGTALLASIGGDNQEFEEEYLVFLKSRFNITALLVDMSYLWLFLAVIVIIGAFLSYRKKNKYYKKWEEEEKYQSTDFDYGDSDNPEQVDDEDKPWD